MSVWECSRKHVRKRIARKSRRLFAVLFSVNVCFLFSFKNLYILLQKSSTPWKDQTFSSHYQLLSPTHYAKAIQAAVCPNIRHISRFSSIRHNFRFSFPFLPDCPCFQNINKILWNFLPFLLYVLFQQIFLRFRA